MKADQRLEDERDSLVRLGLTQRGRGRMWPHDHYKMFFGPNKAQRFSTFLSKKQHMHFCFKRHVVHEKTTRSLSS